MRGGAIYLGVPTIRSLIYALLPAGATTVMAVHCSAVVQDMHRPPVRLRAYHRWSMLVRCFHGALQRCGTAVLARSAGALLHCGTAGLLPCCSAVLPHCCWCSAARLRAAGARLHGCTAVLVR